MLFIVVVVVVASNAIIFPSAHLDKLAHLLLFCCLQSKNRLAGSRRVRRVRKGEPPFLKHWHLQEDMLSIAVSFLNFSLLKVCVAVISFA